MSAAGMPTPRTIDLDLLLKRLGGFPIIGLAHAGSAEKQARWARDDLKARNILLRGHRSAIDALVAFEIAHKKSQLQMYDEFVDNLLLCRTDGRPNKHSALRDLLIFTQQFFLQSVGRLEIRDARKRTAQMLGLTCDTKFVRTRRLSIDQVKWAEERTIARFRLLERWRGDQLLSSAWLKAVYVLGFYIAEMNGAPLDPEAFCTDATCLVSVCRTLEAVERLDRIEKSAARKAGKRMMGQRGNARPELSVN
ncbi:hypothetical protein [Bradyrhizobium erythrophlei]|uniref:Uncharacterized protein n=1 Tax=Bradyrhizobium erythrophlei TaxID=1437360 RepID=A0A1M5R3D5_9BRAD|nr:hypothetical protein [Bradyrhizobium erythrophlei]SHH20658.1 hypothetical protein SAMN05444169_6313 [Bradyrhizobium erythrophlei]